MNSELRQLRVLIVDDERNIADSLVRIFEAAGYASKGAYSAEAAREMLQVWCPDLAIVDVRLPQMSGIEFAILLRAQCRACRLMLFSGQTQTTELLELARKQGYTFDIFAKPVHPAELLSWAAAPALPDGEPHGSD